MSRGISTQKARKMRDLLRKFAESDESQSAFASRHGLSVSTLKYWRNRLGDASPFVPVEFDLPASRTMGSVLIRYPHGIEVQLPADWNVEHIRALCEPFD